jgi:hypothetical protein
MLAAARKACDAATEIRSVRMCKLKNSDAQRAAGA